MKIEAHSKVLMIGDSITDCGRARPIGEGHGGQGTGYVNIVNALLTARYPERRIEIVNMGSSGHTARHLRGRWQSDVIEQKPNWLSIKIGINDVWRQFDKPLSTDIHVKLDEYRETLQTLVAEARPGLTGLILISPYFIEPNRDEPMRAMMDEYGAVVAELAKAEGAIFVDTQAAFDQVMTSMHPMQLAGDRVHPGPVGHMILARAFLQAIGYEW